MMPFVWMDQERRYFITTCWPLEEGQPYVRRRCRQVNQEPNADAERVVLVVPEPKACEVYFTTGAAIDQSNGHRQDALKLERKIETTNWAT